MNTLVLYDSQFGNTEKVAQEIGEVLNASSEVTVAHVSELVPNRLAEYQLVVAGSPTQRFRPTPAMTTFLKSLPAGVLNEVGVAAFDTRLTLVEIEKVRVLAFFVRIFGYAAEPIARQLQRAGGRLIAEPQGFYVLGMEGPLATGEFDRARSWARSLVSTH